MTLWLHGFNSGILRFMSLHAEGPPAHTRIHTHARATAVKSINTRIKRRRKTHTHTYSHPHTCLRASPSGINGAAGAPCPWLDVPLRIAALADFMATQSSYLMLRRGLTHSHGSSYLRARYLPTASISLFSKGTAYAMNSASSPSKYCKRVPMCVRALA
jgi:hypothetical protein